MSFVKIEREDLLTNGIKICENCEWCCYHEQDGEVPHCLLDGEQKGLLEFCDKFKKKTGEHFTFMF